MLLDMLKDEFKKTDSDLQNGKDEGDYNTVYDMLLRKINLGYEGRIKSISNTLYPELRDCTKLLRYSLKPLFTQGENKHTAFIIDDLWKIMLLTVETLLEYESRKVQDSMEYYKRCLASEQEKYKKRIARLNEREKELDLEYTIKKEWCDSQVEAALEAKKRLEEELKEKINEVEQLFDPSRFIYIHHFLSEFQYKFEVTYDNRLEQLRNVQNILKIMISDENLPKELNDELSTTEAYFPKNTISVIRKLQERLAINIDEIKYRIKRNANVIASIMDGTYGIKQFISNYAQTDASKESSTGPKTVFMLFQTKNRLRKNRHGNLPSQPTDSRMWSMSHQSPTLVHQKMWQNKSYPLILLVIQREYDQLDMNSTNSDFGNFLYEALVIKHGLKSLATTAFLSLFSVSSFEKDQQCEQCLKSNARDSTSYCGHLLRLIGLHKDPYSVKDGSVCMKGIKLFNIAQSRWTAFTGCASGNQVKADLLMDVATGGSTNLIMLVDLVQNTIKGDVKKKLLRKMKIAELPQNKLKGGFEIRYAAYYGSLTSILYGYYQHHKKLPDWKEVVEGLPKKDILRKEEMVEAMKKYFGNLFTEENLLNHCERFESLGKGKLFSYCCQGNGNRRYRI
eukprot:TRINITY_DN121853_c0_g1_i1.p1 TRINITY_DN121853_c0_g1~~TRINITY_DN121853_c0_g1_i1.p1  ORF type:complete len:622 (+),score=45.53 TRINITY_DN121853_c0_g1_i1:732-2597(+)